MLGLVTIGQSPRGDIIDSMFGQREAPQYCEAGALDGLTDVEIAELAPTSGEHVLVTRLADGREVTIAKERILVLLQRAVSRVEDAGARLVCVLCTGSFPTLATSTRLVFPDRLMTGVIDGIMPGGTLGVLIPHPEQADTMREKWSSQHRQVATASFSPYEPGARVEQAVEALEGAGVDAIVMDCMGYDRRMLREVRGLTDRTVMLANGLVGAVLLEMLGPSLVAGDEAQ